MEFHKYTALGNDYIVIDPNKESIFLTEERIKRLCDRNFGIGADGILYGPIFEGNKVRLKIYNSDGTEAEMCGNGFRMFARYLHDQNLTYDDSIELITKGGIIKIDRVSRDRYSVNLGKYKIIDEHKEFVIGNEKLVGVSIELGNPHCVLVMDRISRDMAFKFGKYIENYPDFKHKTNVQFAQILDENNIAIEIWERGSGYTLASGTSSAAAAAVLYELKATNKNVTVHMPGGNIVTEIKDGEIIIEGGVSFLFSGKFNKGEL
ncbi:MAG: diaminopimelate epimerase [Clostridia bacterium]|jgi:diaminopimelate epimerase|nr:diaminopimelate epimerase [Clostridia bacterium]